MILPTLLFATFAPLLQDANGSAPPPANPQGTPATPDATLPKAKIFDENLVMARVNEEVVTARDVMREWRWEGRATSNPDRSPIPPPEEQRRLTKEIAMARLWLAHARQYPLYGEFVTLRMIEDQQRDMFGPLLADPALPRDERELLRFKAEALIAQYILMGADPEFQRVSNVRPADVRRFLDRFPEQRHVPTTVRFGRVILGREVYGERTEELAQQIRQRSLEAGGLEAAANELAPGSYKEQPEENVDKASSLRDDVLAFVRTANPGEVSAPIVGQTSVMLFSVLHRQDGHEIPFEVAAPDIKKGLETLGRAHRTAQYFVRTILRDTTFNPTDLFNEEIDRFMPVLAESNSSK